MSGMYKWTEVTFDPTAATYDVATGCAVLAVVAAARASAAAAEAADRMEAEESALREMLAEAQTDGRSAVAQVRAQVHRASSDLTEFDRRRLLDLLDAADVSVGSARTHAQLREALIGAERAMNELGYAARRKRAEDIRRGRTDTIEAWREQFDLLKRQVAELSAEGGFDAAADRQIKSLSAAAAGALQTTNAAMIAAKIGDLESALERCRAAIADGRDGLALRAAAGAQARDESVALVRGLRADGVVMRWHSRAVDALESDLTQIAGLLDCGEFERAAQMVAEARERAKMIVREANGAQIKADQRDYIARSIAQTLEDMGFVVGPEQAEHPDHPATATIIHAATAGGRNIAVSIPVDGQVWYNVQGFPKSTESAVGGGEAAVCDEAEEVITEMHEALASEFHLQMGELMWDGKDPQRKLRAVQSLPKSSASGRVAGASKR